MPLFFGLRRPVEATVDIVALLGINGYLAYLWGSVDRVAGLLLVPYVAWLGFATYLSAGVGHLNGWDLSEGKAEGDKKQA
jgi:translocator protein